MTEGRNRLRPLRTLLEGATITASRGDLDTPVRAVRHDSRRVVPGDVFFALDGARTRGLDFVGDARRRGAAAVVAASLAEGFDGPAVAVADVRRVMALAACVAADHPTASVPTVGITGTNGKTTITYLLEAALAAVGQPAGIIGTIDAHYGDHVEDLGHSTPEAPELQRVAGALLDAGARSLVMEVTSHGIKLARVHGVRYRVVAFTNLTQDHLDFHGTMEDYGATKLRLFTEELRFSPGVVGVVNVDDPHGERLVAAARCPVLTVSTAPGRGADVRVLDRDLSVAGVRATLEVAGRRVALRSPLVGEHNLSNLAVAIGICQALGLPLEPVAAAIGGVTRVPGRLEAVADPRGSAVFVDYAHTPDALSRVSEALARFTAGRLFVLFGCGGDRDRSKRPRMAAAAAAGGDVVVLTSDNPRTEDPLSIIGMALEGFDGAGMPRLELADLEVAERGYAVEPDRRRAIAAAVGAARPGDVVLIAGKGHEDYQILGTTKIHFDDREEAAAAIGAALAGRRDGDRDTNA